MTDVTAPAEPVAEPATAVPVTPPAIMAAAEPAAPVAPARPDDLPDAYWDETAGVKPEAYSRLAQLEAAEEARRAGVPESPDKYELKLAEPIVGLDGQPVQFDASDPLAQAVLPVLHELGVGQDGVSKILGAYAALEVEAAKEQAAFVQAEQTKLGAEHARRTAALHGTVTAQIGAESAEVLRQHMTSAAAVIALEQLVARVAGPSLSAAPPAGPADQYESIASLPVEQRLAAARAAKAG